MKIFLFFCLFLTSQAFAVYSEIGANYSYKKSTYDSNNNIEQQSSTGSLSLYFWEQLGFEFSYTNGLYVKKEKKPGNDPTYLKRTTTQYSDIYGIDVIYLFANKQAKFQPFIKGGTAYVKRKQVLQDEGQVAFTIEPSPGFAPSYGVGLKFYLTESLAVRAGYDIIRTPIDDSASVDDISGRLGLSWML
jgi:opacity protein-like surface antigen